MSINKDTIATITQIDIGSPNTIGIVEKNDGRQYLILCESRDIWNSSTNLRLLARFGFVVVIIS